MPWQFVIDCVAASRNYWVASVGPQNRVHAMPIWGVLIDDDLYLETDPRTRKARNIAVNPSVAVHLEDGDQVVIVEGLARAHAPDADLGAKLAAAFSGKYSGYDRAPNCWDGGGMDFVDPLVVFAWRGMPTALRWRFESPA